MLSGKDLNAALVRIDKLIEAKHGTKEYAKTGPLKFYRKSVLLKKYCVHRGIV